MSNESWVGDHLANLKQQEAEESEDELPTNGGGGSLKDRLKKTDEMDIERRLALEEKRMMMENQKLINLHVR